MSSRLTPAPSSEAREASSPPPLVLRLALRRRGRSRYRILEEIDRGAMGCVLKVWDRDLRRSLAMKVILEREGSDPDASRADIDRRKLERFLEEAQITSQLDHPCILPIHDVGLDRRGRVFFTMPLVRGMDLGAVYRRVRQRRDGWTLERSVGVLIKICQAVAHAHSKGVIHRDLKPGNVMVGRFGAVHVMDWGLARAQGRPDVHDLRVRLHPHDSVVMTDRLRTREVTPDSPLVTMDGDVVGTPQYMAPEQAEGRLDAVGPRSDVYSLGAMLYELLTGQMPYLPAGARISPATTLAMVLQGPPRSVRALDPHAPAGLVAICQKAMARDLQDRYADATELAHDLEAWLERRPVSALRPRWRYLARLAIERNLRQVITLTGALAVVVVLLSVFFVRLTDTVRDKEQSLRRTAELLEPFAAAPLALNRQWEELRPFDPAAWPAVVQWIERADFLLGLWQLSPGDASDTGSPGSPAGTGGREDLRDQLAELRLRRDQLALWLRASAGQERASADT